MDDQQYTVDESNTLYEEGKLPGAKDPIPPERIDFCVIAVNVVKDRFMHAAGMFGPFKVLIEEPIRLSGYIKPGETTTSCLSKTRAALEQTGEYRVIAIWRMGHSEGAWHDPAVKVVSTGRNRGLFMDMLDRMAYPLDVKEVVS